MALAVALGLTTQKAFAERLHVSQQYASDLLGGKRGVGEQVLTALAVEGVNLNWLLTGRGPMFQAAAPPAAREPGIAYVPSYDVQLGAGDGRFPLSEEVRSVSPYREDVIRQLTTNPENLVELEVDGESMVPTFNPGERVLVDTTKGRTLKDGIWAVSVDDALLIKRVQRLPGRLLRFSSDNTAYSAFEVAEREIGQSVWIVGRVLLGARRY